MTELTAASINTENETMKIAAILSFSKLLIFFNHNISIVTKSLVHPRYEGSQYIHVKIDHFSNYNVTLLNPAKKPNMMYTHLFNTAYQELLFLISYLQMDVPITQKLKVKKM